MKAAVWHGPRDVRVDEVEDPKIEEPTDAVIKITSSAICGSDLHLYEILSPFMTEGDILGHEPMGIVEEVGPEVTHIKPGDRVVDPLQHLLRPLLDVRPPALRPVRDDPEPRGRKRRLAVRLHQALRPGAGRAGRVPARAAGALRADQGARGPARRPLPLPLRRAADLLAGGRVRGDPGGRLGRRLRARPDRPDDRPHRRPQRRAGDRRRPRPRAARAGGEARDRDARPRRARRHLRRDPRDDRGPRHRRARSTRSGWRRTAPRSASSPRKPPACSPTRSPRS